MKTLQKTLLVLMAGSLMSVGAQAAMSYGNGQAYVGAKVGQYSPDEADDDAFSYGIYGGYKFTPEIGVEAEYLTTSDTDAFEDAFGKSEYNADVYGIYATYGYAFPNSALYAKGRLGVAKNKIDIEYTDKIDVIDNNNASFSDTGVAGSLGLGYNITPMASVEALYNYYPTIETDGDEDIDVNGVTLGAHFKF